MRKLRLEKKGEFETLKGFGDFKTTVAHTVTSNTNYSHQIQIAHIKYKSLTSNTNCSHQIQITHIKYKILTSNTKFWHQTQITRIKYKLLTSNTNYSHQIQHPDIKHKLLTSNKNCSHQIQITHIIYKILKSKTRLNGQRSDNENYVQFSLGLDPTAILLLHMVLSSGCFAANAEEMSTIATFLANAGKVS